MNLNPEKIYDWKIWLVDGRVIRRSENIHHKKGDGKHIDPQNPPVQATKIAWINLDDQCLDCYCPVPTGGRPICFWRLKKEDFLRTVGIKFFLGFELNSQRVYRVIEIPERIDRLEIRKAEGEIK